MVRTIGVYCSTQGRDTLERMLHSIRHQQRLEPGDKVYLMGDGPVPAAEHLAARYGFDYFETPQTHDWGHTQVNRAIELLDTDILVGQDDDDIFAPRAFDVIRSADLPCMFHFDARNRDGTIYPTESAADGHCLVVPNLKHKIGRFGHIHSGDQQFLNQTHHLWGEIPRRKEIISIAVPQWRLWPWLVQTPDQVESLRVIRNECRAEMTHARDEITPASQIAWWSQLDHTRHWAYLYTLGPELPYVAFSFISSRDGRPHVSYGLATSARGHKLSYDMVQHALIACQGDAYGDLWESNAAIWHVDQACGWVEVGREGGLIKARCPWPV